MQTKAAPEKEITASKKFHPSSTNLYAHSLTAVSAIHKRMKGSCAPTCAAQLMPPARAGAPGEATSTTPGQLRPSSPPAHCP